jgi:hypothetical protein
LVISTGTSGALNGNLQIGDVVIAETIVLNCTGPCKEPFNDRWSSDNIWFKNRVSLPNQQLDFADKRLMQTNLPYFAGERIGAPSILWKDGQLGDKRTIVTTDRFAFADTRDSFGINHLGAVTEMNDAVLGLATKRLGGNAPKWLSIRNVSVPSLCGDSINEETKAAAAIYLRYSHWTSIQSAIATWAVISGSP